MIFFEGPRVISPSVWARGGQAPLRAQAFLLSWHCLSAIQASSRPILAGRDAEAGERRWPERGRPRCQAFVQLLLSMTRQNNARVTVDDQAVWLNFQRVEFLSEYLRVNKATCGKYD